MHPDQYFGLFEMIPPLIALAVTYEKDLTTYVCTYYLQRYIIDSICTADIRSTVTHLKLGIEVF